MSDTMRYLSCGLCLLAALSGCGRPVTRSDLPGTYVATYPFATETVDLAPDGHFAQTVRVTASGKVVVAKGTWRFDPELRDVWFSDDFLEVIDGFGQFVPDFDQPKRRLQSVFPVRRCGGRLQLGADPGVPYYKQAARGAAKP